MKPKLLKKLSKSLLCDMEQPIVALHLQFLYGHKKHYRRGPVPHARLHLLVRVEPERKP